MVQAADIFLVSHFHWDREWYRSFEEFRGRLVDAVDAVLDLVARDAGFRFVLDGQAIVLEDYVEIRPERRAALVDAIRAGRLAAGPWYVQPDSLLPSGEAHVRNLLHGRGTATAFGVCSGVAYVPDSFGHPAQLPQLFAGFGLDPFVYWRGNDTAADALGRCYRWRAPDGSVVRAWHLVDGYFDAGGLDAALHDVGAEGVAGRLEALLERLRASGAGPVALMNGFDHLPPDETTAAIAARIGARRALLDEAAASLPVPDALPVYEGALVGARTANLLPGVWSARMPLKLGNRRVETLLTAWAEPWAGFGAALGLADERPALDRGWRALLQNQAHDSIGGCSIDAVHDRMRARFDDAEGVGRATVTRVLERLAGRDPTRGTPWRAEQDVVVFNASPYPHTDVVRVPLDGFPPWRMAVGQFEAHPLTALANPGFTVDGKPLRVVASDDPARVRFLPGVGGFDVELVAHAVPAFGCRRYRLALAAPVADEEDAGTDIGADDTAVRVAADGTLDVTLAGRTYRGCFGIEDAIDRGDSYDCDLEPRAVQAAVVSVRRRRHVGGIGRIAVVRALAGVGTLSTEATVAPGVPFVRVTVTVDNRATDHRLRLRFPTGASVDRFLAATTFDVARRTTTPVDDAHWVHPAPRTFVHQGWTAAHGLVVGAPGLPEAEVTPAGDVLVTLVRSVGALARLAVRTRPLPAGPEMAAPGAQVLGPVAATITLAPTPAEAHAAEVGLWGVLGGDTPRLADGVAMLELDARQSVLSACKPAADGDGLVVRVLNPADEPDDVTLRFGLDVHRAIAVRLDETRAADALKSGPRSVRMAVPGHALRSVRVTFRD